MVFSKRFVLTLYGAFLVSTLAYGEEEKIVIAHRGASGYLPEHTLAAKAMAYAMGVDFIEQDIVLTKDSHAVILHDIYLDTVTDVTVKFPDRVRDDGRYYAIDFSLAEIRQLLVTERLKRKTGLAVFPKRFPLQKSRFTVSTLAEEIELIQGLNHSTGRNVGLYCEIKSPKWHREEGKDITKIVLKILDEYGYRDREDNIYLQCFDMNETKRIRLDLKSNLKLVQLVGNDKWKKSSPENTRLLTPAGIQELATYADGIGPSMKDVVIAKKSGKWQVTPLVQLAHTNGLKVHPYTFRQDSLPKFVSGLDELLDIFFREARVDGVFTDFPDVVVDYLHQDESR